GPEQLSVADIDGLLYLPNRSRRTLERAVRIPALSAGWKGSFRELLEQGEAAAAPPPPAWPGFQPLTVTAIRQESATIASFTLAPADRSSVDSAIGPGQYLTVRLRPDGPDQPAVIRSYSMSTTAGEAGYRISVKHEPDGVGSSFLHQHVSVGDTIEAAAPRGSFTLRDGERAVVLLSAGVGATPVLAMLHALAAARSTREVWWLHGARDGREHAFGAEVDRLLASLPHAHRIVSYSRPDPGDTPGIAFDAVGRVSVEMIADAGIPVNADYYLCGPDAFMHELSAALIAGGAAPEHVAMEVFGAQAVTFAPGLNGDRPAPHAPSGAPGTGPPVTFSRSNLVVPWDPSYGNLLEFAEVCDIPVSFGCRTGVCHSCQTGLLTGEVAYTTEPLEPPDREQVLVCCAQPAGDITLEL
ncbi:MAG: 3-alpha domain-containing protein, partial [Solirubrobacteraceae bacterium]